MDQGSTEIVRHVVVVEDLVKSQDSCPLCEGTGTMSWQQPDPGGTELRTIEMNCPNGCGGHWTYPHAEKDRVVEQADDTPARSPGLALEADYIGADFIRAALDRWGFGPDGTK